MWHPRRLAGLVVGALTLVSLFEAGPARAEPGPADPRLNFSTPGNPLSIPDGTGDCTMTGRAGRISVPVEVSGVTERISGLTALVYIKHPFVGDLSVSVEAPNGRRVQLFGNTGGCPGESAALVAPYRFTDVATAPHMGWHTGPQNWWTAAAEDELNGGWIYSPSDNGGGWIDISAEFGKVANPNGTWYFLVSDRAAGRTGTFLNGELYVFPDQTAPLVTLTDTTQDGSMLVRAPSVTFNSTAEDVDHYLCQADGASAVPCTSPVAGPSGVGVHSVSVRAIDSSGNLGPSVVRNYVVDPNGVEPPAPGNDVTPPGTRLIGGTGDGAETTGPRFVFGSIDRDVGEFRCQLDGGAWKACASPLAPNLAAGRHTFEVAAMDEASNLDPSPVAVAFRVLATDHSGCVEARAELRVARARLKRARAVLEAALDSGKPRLIRKARRAVAAATTRVRRAERAVSEVC